MGARTACLVRGFLGIACFWSTAAPVVAQPAPADILLVNGRVYTFAWDEPSPDGTPAANAPRSAAGFRLDAEALAISGDRIVFVGGAREAHTYRGPKTRVMDLGGATVLPGLVDSHTHIVGLGEAQSQVDLVGVELLSDRVPDHPTLLAGLHGFAVWANRLALERAGITPATVPPEGGEIVKDGSGDPTGILLNRATSLLTGAVPEPTEEQYKAYVLAGLTRMARDGYVAVHEAGADRKLMKAFQSLDAEARLPVRVYAMLSARDVDLCREWQRRGPDRENGRMLTTRSVKAFYDGALGSRGARLLDDYSDRPGHRGVSGHGYGFDQSLAADMMKAGFQIAIHAIGDAGNRETLDFIASVLRAQPDARTLRHRIEHAQVLHPDDVPRFAALGVIASMEPPHCVEDKAWAEARLGPVRVKGAYAWRTLRRAGARLAFNSDLTGSDHDIFYGLHAAITRRDKELQPPGGWYPEERMTAEEAVRGYTTWNAYAASWEKESGVLASGRWADITVMDLDPLVVGATDPGKLLRGSILATIVGGRVAYAADAVGRAAPRRGGRP